MILSKQKWNTVETNAAVTKKNTHRANRKKLISLVGRESE